MELVSGKKSSGAPTLQDVALRAGTHKMAVSVVINGSRSSARVSEATRQRILSAAHDLGYSPNVTARSLKSVHYHSLGVAFPYANPTWITYDYYGIHLLRGMILAAHKSGYNVTHFHKPWKDAKQSAIGFRGQGIDGFLIVAPTSDSDIVPGLAALGIPLVVISTPSDQYGVPSVDVDNAKGARLAMNHLIELGHGRIAHFVEAGNGFDTAVRLETFRKAMAEAGLSVPPDYIMDDAPDTFEKALELLKLPVRPTAVFTTNSRTALGLMRAARELGIRIPEDLSIVGFDDNPGTDLAIPPLTSVRQPLVAMAEHATRLLISLIEGEPVTPETHWFEPEFIIRGSTAPPE